MDKNTILFVDDEIHILNSLKRGLIDEPYACLFAQGGQEALDLMEKYDIHVIVTDMRMPGMNGLELLKIIEDKYPNVIKVVLSGYTQLPQILATINQVDIFKFITKPWKLEEEFKKVLHDSVQYYNLKDESIKLKQELKIRNNMYQTILKNTDDKFRNINNNVELFNKIFSTLLNSMSEDLKKSQNHIKEKLEFNIETMKGIMPFLLYNINSTMEEYDLKRIINDIKKNILCNGIQVEIENFINKKYYGNYKFLNLIFQLLFNSFSICKSDDILLKFYENKDYVRITILFNKNIKLNQLRVKDRQDLFNQIFKLIKSNISINLIEQN